MVLFDVKYILAFEYISLRTWQGSAAAVYFWGTKGSGVRTNGSHNNVKIIDVRKSIFSYVYSCQLLDSF